MGYRKASEMKQERETRNVFEVINEDGDDTRFVPLPSDDFIATEAPAGSQQKIDDLRRRLELGVPLWHADDRKDYRGLVGAIRPRADTYSSNA